MWVTYLSLSTNGPLFWLYYYVSIKFSIWAKVFPKATCWESGKSSILHTAFIHRNATPIRWQIPDTGRINILSGWSKSIVVMVVSLEDWQGGIVWCYKGSLLNDHSFIKYSNLQWPRMVLRQVLILAMVAGSLWSCDHH